MEHVRAGMYKIISILRRIAKIGIETGIIRWISGNSAERHAHYSELSYNKG